MSSGRSQIETVAAVNHFICGMLSAVDTRGVTRSDAQTITYAAVE